MQDCELHHVVPATNRRRAVVNAVMNFRFQQNPGNLVSS
jgi:hypothetical protein